MLKISSPIDEIYSFNSFLMKEKKPIVKINLRGNPKNKEFTSNLGKKLGIIISTEVGNIVTKEEISIITIGPNEWLLISNSPVDKNDKDYELENNLFDSISKNNLGSVTNVSEQFSMFSLSGPNIFEVLSKSSPFNFDTLQDNCSVQTLLNHIDITVIKKSNENVDLLVRRSFAEHLWNWIKDSSKYTL